MVDSAAKAGGRRHRRRPACRPTGGAALKTPCDTSCPMQTRSEYSARPLSQGTQLLPTQALIGLSVTSSGRLLRQDLLLAVPPPQRRQRANGTEQKATAGPRGDTGGDRVTVAAPVGSPDAGGEAHAARARLAAAQALGQLAFTCSSGLVPSSWSSCLCSPNASLQHTPPGCHHCGCAKSQCTLWQMLVCMLISAHCHSQARHQPRLCLLADNSPVAEQILAQLQTPSATGRLVSALAVAAWARSAAAADQPASMPATLTARIHELLAAATPSQPTPGWHHGRSYGIFVTCVVTYSKCRIRKASARCSCLVRQSRSAYLAASETVNIKLW